MGYKSNLPQIPVDLKTIMSFFFQL